MNIEILLPGIILCGSSVQFIALRFEDRCYKNDIKTGYKTIGIQNEMELVIETYKQR